jgi:hypothetical protein
MRGMKQQRQQLDYREFQRMYYCSPMSDADISLNELAMKYHEQTERYDRSVCSGPIVDGAIMPANGRERAAINRNAAKVRDALCVEAMRLGFGKREWQSAIFNAGRRV